MTKLRIAAIASFVWASAMTSVAAQSVVAVPVLSFRFAGTPDAALARIRPVVARCWQDDYDSRVLGRYREVVDVSAAPGGEVTVRLEWRRVVDDRAGDMLKRAFDIALVPDGGATRVTVLVYGPHSEVGRDVEAWFAGREKCFERRTPSP